MKLLLLFSAAVVAAMYALIGHEEHFVFTPEEMKQYAAEAIAETGGEDADKIVAAVVQKMQKAHPEHIEQGDMEWIFNNAGGAMGSMIVLHASFSEYIIIFGTAVGTEGHTGRFFADDYFTILYGEQWAHSAGNLQKEVYHPGDQHHLPRLESKQYKMPDACWALEYARGNIPFMLPFGMFDTFFSTLDIVTFVKTVQISAQQMLTNAVKGKF